MTFLIGQIVRSRLTGLMYRVVAHDEPTLDGQEVVIIVPEEDDDLFRSFPVAAQWYEEVV